MATALFDVTVMSREDTLVVFRTRIISAEQPAFAASRSFALMLMYDPIARELTPDAPLAHAVSFERTMDPVVCRNSADQETAEFVGSRGRGTPARWKPARFTS